MRIYFAHPIADYDTQYEKECLLEIKRRFPGCTIVNPNSEKHQQGYNRSGMNYFVLLAATCHKLIAVPFRDGKFGAGVWTEAMSHNYVKVLDGVNIRNLNSSDMGLSISETRERIRQSRM